MLIQEKERNKKFMLVYTFSVILYPSSPVAKMADYVSKYVMLAKERLFI